MTPSAKEGVMAGVRVERLAHLGIVAGVCREIGLAAYLDGLAEPSQQQVSVGTATVAMILHGLGFSNRRLYLVSQCFATKPVEHLLGGGITAEQLHDGQLLERRVRVRGASARRARVRRRPIDSARSLPSSCRQSSHRCQSLNDPEILP